MFHFVLKQSWLFEIIPTYKVLKILKLEEEVQ